MLETSLFESGGGAKTRKPVTVLVSTALHAIVIIVLIVVPLAQPQLAPAFSAAVGFPLQVAAKSDAPKPKLGPAAPRVQPHIVPSPSDFITPTRIPDDIAMVDDEPGAALGPVGAQQTGSIASLLIGMMKPQEIPPEAPPPPPPAAAPPVMGPTRVGGNVQQANLVHQVLPEYPAIARLARIQGVVILEATISKEGTVRDLRVISGHPLLIEAARNAVQQWKYKPTILNGDPIEVITTVTVTFAMQ